MSLLEWSAEFSVGVEEIDRDHQRLMGLLNDLHAAVEVGAGHQVLGVVLDGLILYVSYHFAHEEGLFLTANYPGFENHRRQHQALTDAVKEIYEDFQAGAAETLPDEVLEFLKAWLYKHIMESDRAFGVYLSANVNASAGIIRAAS
jgi:hemerythrin